MSFPIKVTGILKVTCNVVTYASCQQTESCAGTSLPAPGDLFAVPALSQGAGAAQAPTPALMCVQPAPTDGTGVAIWLQGFPTIQTLH